MKAWLAAGFLTAVACSLHAATITVGPWTPLFKGLEFASGRQQAIFVGERNQAVSALRVDLSDPDVRFFGMPLATNGASEVISTTPLAFLVDHGLQVVVNCNFFWPNSLTAGTPTDVLGLAISQGQIVSPTNDPVHPAALLFTTNNQPTFVPSNLPPVSLQGIYTAVSGNHLLLVNGVNYANRTNDVDPRTALGLSQDRRYLVAIVIDGRQTNYSDGATYYETAEWLRRFGAHDGLNVDGGSCATLAMMDCLGRPIRLNSNSYVVTHGGLERGVGHLIGFYAPPAITFVHAVTVSAGDTTATIRWRTPQPATAQVLYGLTPAYGSLSGYRALPMTYHVVTLTNLVPATTYHFRAISTTISNEHSWACRFTTTNFTTSELLFDLTNSWRYTTNNLDGTAWVTREYNDGGWLGSGRGLLCVETNPGVAPRNTSLPPPHGTPLPPTYYFRTRFQFTGETAGVSLLLSNYVDDGAVFYLNGSEIYRWRMRPPPNSIRYTDLATGFACSNAPCSGDACSSCPDVFRIPADRVTLRQGDNLLAVEVHNYSSGSPDIVFGSAVFALRPFVPAPELSVLQADQAVTLFWNGAGLRLQQSAQVGAAAHWTDVPEASQGSPCVLTNLASTRFYRLRR